ECVEVARRILDEAAKGTRFDQMAIVARSGTAYRAHLVEALRRAKVPAYFARGTTRPDPAGRALAALLSCAAEGLSARRFAEYLSLGELPDATSAGEPPLAQPLAERVGLPDEDMLPDYARDELDEPDLAEQPPPAVTDPAAHAVVDGSLHAPANWERLLSDAAVIRGTERWRRRLEGLEHELELDLREIRDVEEPEGVRLKKRLADLGRLRTFALPIIADLAALPHTATWGEWRQALSKLATRTLRRPDRVLSILAELAPMDALGDVSLADVRLLLDPRLCTLVERPTARRYGSVYIGEPSDVRGLTFDVVFVVGVAEKVFPRKVAPDPIFPDKSRAKVDSTLETNATRTANERLALRLAVGAATRRVVVSYPRLDTDLARPRTPSFYALELLRAAEGRLPGFEELARRAEVVGGARIGWPAPRKREDAVDEAEHDLALLETIFAKDEADTTGMARFLLSANAYLARAFRSRALRWQKGWSYADGLVLLKQPLEARAALDAHLFANRSYSPTALQNFSACPYKFVLQAIFRLSPQQEKEQIEELDPLQRGSLLHEIEFELHVRLRELGLLPITPANLERAREELDLVVKA
ncbi:MAG: PD-(D/E)XK nuclease family protein, partial [Polyangiaceae bacterium]